MSKTISAQFKSRRDAEMAVEHIVQEHGVDRTAVEVGAASGENTAGTEAARADIEDGHPKTGTDGEPALAGKVEVSVRVDDASVEAVVSSLKTYHGEIAS
ncbi:MULTISPECIES: hypothetical protein [unclassified Methylobacterium]|uniref:hypothetical protein n=1 Tax=unclassified Methylobacterium TaxID=2615210 RepID=UPI0006F36A94|nr:MULTISPECIES: hypothetical protein [unclassified Methylobacterium]KQP61181.1 hypothetical protein ASF39_00245 [Methylobacterium sp. Leaf108]KQT78270.1 hypothetical protein ASG59_09870 [Methylobacterium sp. Leaf466]